MDKVNAEIRPEGSLEVLSRSEIAHLHDYGTGDLYALLRVCILAVLNAGTGTDDTRRVLEENRDFTVEFIQEHRGLKLRLLNAPGHAFVDGRMIRGIREQIFAVLRDLIYTTEQLRTGNLDLASSDGITDAIFHILRNAGLLEPPPAPNMVVCWGGHSIGSDEYDYSKRVGYRLGLSGLNVCTGCGPGAMKGPMKGATIGHAKQRIANGKYVGITEPTIIAAESPNPIVNKLVIMPDMEKRLEAFIRYGHAIVIFPGGVGTLEEILFLLGVLIDEANGEHVVPVILTGPASSRDYFLQIDRFIEATLGKAAASLYSVIIDDPGHVAHVIKDGLRAVQADRDRHNDAYAFNWRLSIDPEFQKPFLATHESMRGLELFREAGPHRLAVNLRRVFSGLVAGNVREDGIRAVEEMGPFEIRRGEPTIMAQLDELLAGFVRRNRMRLPGMQYNPCYRIIS